MTEQELTALETLAYEKGHFISDFHIGHVEQLIAEIRRLQNAHVACPACGSDWDLNQPDTFHTQLVDERNLLKKQIADAPTIHLQFTEMEGHDEFSGMSVQDDFHTHTARLVDIRLITNEIEEK